ncbi:MAG: hypothetical protein ACYC1D_11440 [Acidimicrobiales bacterium]
MFWWYVGEVLALVTVLPIVLILLNRLLQPVLEINSYADDILEHGVGLTGTLDAVPKLARTKELTGIALQGVGRYGAALKRLL